MTKCLPCFPCPTTPPEVEEVHDISTQVYREENPELFSIVEKIEEIRKEYLKNNKNGSCFWQHLVTQHPSLCQKYRDTLEEIWQQPQDTPANNTSGTTSQPVGRSSSTTSQPVGRSSSSHKR